MAKIDELLAAAREEAKNAQGEEKVKAEARAATLLEMKGEGFKLSDDEVGGLVKRKEDEAKAQATKWSELIGMPYEEAEKLMGELDDDAIQALFSGGEDDDDKPVIERFQDALEARDQKIRAGEEYTKSLAQDLYSERVEKWLKSALGDVTLDDGTKVSLKDGRFDRVRTLVGEDDLIKKLIDGQTIEAEVFSEAAKNLYGDMPELFVGAENKDVADDTRRESRMAVRPHIPATPAASGPPDRSATDSYREAKYADRQTRQTG